MALPQPLGWSTSQRNQPHVLLNALRETARVGIFAAHLHIATASVNNRFTVRRPVESPDVLAIVAGVGGDRLSLVRGWLRRPDVAHSSRVEHPGNGAAGGSGLEALGKR